MPLNALLIQLSIVMGSFHDSRPVRESDIFAG